MSNIHIGTPGRTYYAKETGSSVSPWSTGVVPYTELPLAGVFAAATDNGETYVIYDQLTGSPLATDSIDGTVGVVSPTAAEIQAIVEGVIGNSGVGEFFLTVQVNSSVAGNPGLHNVRVAILGSSTRQFTDVMGNVVFRVEAGDYTLSFVAPPQYAAVADLPVTSVTADREVVVILTPSFIPLPDDPLLCNCLLIVLDQLGSPIAGATISPVMVGQGTADGGAFVFNEPVTFTTDVDGRVFMQLHRKRTYDFFVSVTDLGSLQVVKRIPDLPTHLITIGGQVAGAC